VDGEQLAKMLPSLDDIDLDTFSNVSSLIPSMDKKLKEEQIRSQHAHSYQSQQMHPGQFGQQQPQP